jgi:hypothetical protein
VHFKIAFFEIATPNRLLKNAFKKKKKSPLPSFDTYYTLDLGCLLGIEAFCGNTVPNGHTK